MDRLDEIHKGLKSFWGKNLSVPINGRKFKMLDVGCGTGIWMMEVAKDFPGSQVVGVDLSPHLANDSHRYSIPDNISFEVWTYSHVDEMLIVKGR